MQANQTKEGGAQWDTLCQNHGVWQGRNLAWPWGAPFSFLSMFSGTVTRQTKLLHRHLVAEGGFRAFVSPFPLPQPPTHPTQKICPCLIDDDLDYEETIGKWRDITRCLTRCEWRSGISYCLLPLVTSQSRKPKSVFSRLAHEWMKVAYWVV